MQLEDRMTGENRSKRSLAVFCGSRTGKDPRFTDAARKLGVAMVRHGFDLVYGAGHVGLMGVVADAVLDAGGKVVGVIPQSLVDRELAHGRLSELLIVSTMHERKKAMADRASGFIAIPGGFGTLDETFEMLTWSQLKIHQKPVAWMNVAGFFDPLLQWIDHAIDTDFVQEKNRRLFFVETDPELLLQEITQRLANPGFPMPINL